MMWTRKALIAAGVILAAFLSINSYAADSCPTGSYLNYTATTPVGLGGVPNGSLFSSLGAFQAAFDNKFATGNYCGSYGSSPNDATYTWQVNVALGSVSPTAYGKACMRTSGSATQPNEHPTVPRRYNAISYSCAGTPVKQCTASGQSSWLFSLTGYNSSAPTDACDGSCGLTSPPSSKSAGSVGACVGSTCGATTGTYATVVDYVGTTVACSTKTTGMSSGQSGQAIGTSNALQYQPGTQCGTINGKSFCVGAVPNGACVKTADGWGVCSTSGATHTAVTPPGPNNGTAGTPAAPTGFVQNGDGSGGTNTTTLYDPTTMSGSTVQPPAGSASNGTGTGAPGTTPTTDCKAAGNCTPEAGTFTAPGKNFDFGDMTSAVSDAKQSFTDAMATIRSEAAQEFTPLSTGGGDLPVTHVDVLGRPFTLDFNQYASQLNSVGLAVMFMAAFIAAIIILR